MKLGCARNGNNPRLLGQQPGKRNLSRRCLLLFSDRPQQVNQGLIRLPSLRRKAWQRAAKIGLVERRGFVHFACQKSLAQRTVRNEAYSRSEERRVEKECRSRW